MRVAVSYLIISTTTTAVSKRNKTVLPVTLKMVAVNSETNPAEEFDTQLSPALTQLSNLLANKEFVLATTQGDGELSKTALDAVKSIFDLGKLSDLPLFR